MGLQDQVDFFNKQIERGIRERIQNQQGKVYRVRDNNTCDLLSWNNSKYLREIPVSPMANLTLQEGDNVIYAKPEGSTYLPQIIARSPYEIPDEQVYEFHSVKSPSEDEEDPPIVAT
ncbi:MAG: hypothetical protein BWY64_02375 [bacterium ADurb.Bin363]|nr:MAG: hypothetical protein BWY64_02375 [bacterium ADurb.Bin363]